MAGTLQHLLLLLLSIQSFLGFLLLVRYWHSYLSLDSIGSLLVRFALRGFTTWRAAALLGGWAAVLVIEEITSARPLQGSQPLTIWLVPAIPTRFLPSEPQPRFQSLPTSNPSHGQSRHDPIPTNQRPVSVPLDMGVPCLSSDSCWGLDSCWGSDFC